MSDPIIRIESAGPPGARGKAAWQSWADLPENEGGTEADFLEWLASLGGDGGSMSAADILTALKTVDTDSSGLNADTLDGLQATAFALTDHNHTGTYQPLDAVLTSTTASFTTALNSKLTGIATAATANDTDANLKARANHTGTQAVTTTTFTASSRLAGRVTASGGAAEELTGTQATTLLDTFTTALKGLVPASGGGTTNYLRADGAWAAPAYQPVDTQLTDLAALVYASNGSKVVRVNSGATAFELATLAKADVGLGSVDNTADTAKPISTATQTALDGKSATSHNHDATYQPLDTQLTSLAALSYASNGSKVVRVNSGATAFEVASLAKGDVGLGNVDNTADTAKPISTATQTALDGKMPLSTGINNQTGTTYTFTLSDAGVYVRFNNASAITVTVPANASVAFPVGTEIGLLQVGAGQVTFVAAGGVTILTPETLKLRKSGSGATLIKTGTNAWDFLGDLEVS